MVGGIVPEGTVVGVGLEGPLVVGIGGVGRISGCNERVSFLPLRVDLLDDADNSIGSREVVLRRLLGACCEREGCNCYD